MRQLRRILCVLALAMAWPAVWSQTQPAAQRYAAIAFHDVVDDPRDLDADAITSDRLVAFFDWLRGNGWNAISLDDIVRAEQGLKALPPNPILITFDDGYRSLYTRVYPLALAYRIPVVATLVGAWLDAAPDATVRYGDQTVPRSKFISWEQAREMQASGLIEFASHSYGLHEGVPVNRQGTQLPSAIAHRLLGQIDAQNESEGALHARVKADLERSRALMRQQLGRAPRALAWPFGRYSETGLAAASAAGFSMALTLRPDPADLAQPMAIGRYWPSHNPPLGQLVAQIGFNPVLPAAQRLVCVNPQVIWSADAALFDANLGKAIERLRALGATDAVIDAVALGADGKIEAAWFPSSALPMRGNALSRIAWQLRTRAGVDIVARLAHRAVQDRLPAEQATLALFRELGEQLPFDALMVEDAQFADFSDTAGATWQTAQAREALRPSDMNASDSLALRAFRAVRAGNPELRLILRQSGQTEPARPSAAADLSLFSPAVLAGTVSSVHARRIGVWLEQAGAPDNDKLIHFTRGFQARGGAALGWCPDDPVANRPDAAKVAPAVSAATFPVRF
ncbi:MAG: poly-beta-1,6-N-acetyl-D-glucosamine N-deacetylase PgaB [Rhodoferax sp.]